MNVKNPKEGGQEPFVVTCHGDERWNAIPPLRQDLANTSAPDRLDSPSIGHDERRLEGCPSGSPPKTRQDTLLKRSGEYGSSARDRKESSLDDTLASQLADLSEHLAVYATDGVRKNTTRGGRVGESSAKTTSSDPPRIRSFRRQQCRRTRRERDQPARQHRKMLQPDEENVGFPRQLGSRAHRNLDTARSASHRPTRNRGKTMDGTNANATVRKRGATVMQGIIEARSERKNRHEGDLEGEQGPGRVGQRTSS